MLNPDDFEYNFESYVDDFGPVTVVYDYVEPEEYNGIYEDWDFFVISENGEDITYDIPKKEWKSIYREVKDHFNKEVDAWNQP